MIMWRPKGWKVPKYIIKNGETAMDIMDSCIYEDGADAMLEAVRKQLGVKVPWVIDDKTTLCPGSYGWLHFIPDDPQQFIEVDWDAINKASDVLQTKHFVGGHEVSNYICPTCYKPFYDVEEFLEHLKQHEHKKIYPEFPNNYSSLFYQSTHKASKVIDKGFLCPECGKWFRNSDLHKEGWVA